MSHEDDNVKKYDGDKVDVFWNRKLCIGIGECGRAHDLFVSGRDPWCKPDLAAADDVVEVVMRCPAGALSFSRRDGGLAESCATQNVVIVASRGPLYLKGDLQIDAADGDMPGVSFRAALCRCGASKNKPFCDNEHENVGFRDRGAVNGTVSNQVEDDDEPLKVSEAPDGPLLLTGKFAILAASGRVAWRGTKAALCRCGESKNKPFCDGRHKNVGFKSD